MIFKLFNLGLTIYLIYFLEKIKVKFPTKNLLIKCSSFLIEIQMLLAALNLIWDGFLWLQVSFGILVGILGLILTFLIKEDLNNFLFIDKLMRSHNNELSDFKTKVQLIRNSKNQTCPMKLDCKQMGFKYKSFCANFNVCKRYSYE